MPDKFSVISAERLLKWILEEEKNYGRIFGLSKELFYTPSASDSFKMQRYGQLMETPLGVAAGPQTQMAQNLIIAWLTGSRYLELKTVQTLDELEVSKPCIDMEDAGYNCEWSQELRLHESFNEYLAAWIIIHILRHKFGWEGERGFIFNMSVGYNLEGILKDNVQKFFAQMADCKTEKEEMIERLAVLYPAVRELDIPDKISDNITLSTMHGCPPDEIEKIGRYLIEEKKLNTTIKLNPTLLGPEGLRGILNDKLGFETNVPDEAFGHDLKYPDAIKLIKNLRDSAKANNVAFGLKLTNTLESINHRSVFPENEKMMYMSGRALHPISINLAAKLQTEFNGELDISFSAGADCFNIDQIIASGIKPVTVSSDLLKPGGYGRMVQYLEKLTEKMSACGASNIDEFILATNGDKKDVAQAALANLQKYAAEVADSPLYRKSFLPEKSVKTFRELESFDCIQAPCVTTCPANQSIPEYMYYTAQGEYTKAFDVILRTNPLPTITGMVCDHLCTSKCTRLNYDMPLLIREIKRFVAKNQQDSYKLKAAAANGHKVAIIGAGPAGLSCAFYLALEGYEVNIYESKPFAGGMASDAIPSFRLLDEDINKDIERIESLGVKIHYSQSVDQTMFDKLRSENGAVFVGVGAQANKKMGLEGEDIEGVVGCLNFLSIVRRGENIDIGKTVAIVGGGNSAMDAARTAYRKVGAGGKVTIIYRRTMKEMPADKEEIDAAIEEGIEVLELTNPAAIKKVGDKVILVCDKMRLGEPDASGRRRPIPIEGSQVELSFDTVIPSIGQNVVLDFIDPAMLEADPLTCETKIENVYVGGDALRGALNLITAIADGRKAAVNMMKKDKLDVAYDPDKADKGLSYAEFQKRSASRLFGEKAEETSLDTRRSFDLVVKTLDEKSAQAEASRCLYCSDICNVCVTVCPNRANISYSVEPVEFKLSKIAPQGAIVDDKLFRVEQQNQVLNVADFCNECGNCQTFCPTSGAPYMDKPKLSLTKHSFDVQPKSYMFADSGAGKKISYKENGITVSLEVTDSEYLFTTEAAIIKLDKSDFSVQDVDYLDGKNGEISLVQAAKMRIMLDSLQDSYLFAVTE